MSVDPEPRRVLTVEDDAVVSALVRLTLRDDARFGTVRHASTVASARRQLQDYRPDVVVVDHDLPDGTAGDVLDALRSVGSAAPAVLHSARNDRDALATALGCAAAVAKADWLQIPDVLVRVTAQVTSHPSGPAQPVRARDGHLNRTGPASEESSQAGTSSHPPRRVLAWFSRLVPWT